jgi:hypothetical protein
LASFPTDPPACECRLVKALPEYSFPCNIRPHKKGSCGSFVNRAEFVYVGLSAWFRFSLTHGKTASRRKGCSTNEKLHVTETTLRRIQKVIQPERRLVLRTHQDWDQNIEPVSTSEDGTTWTFELEADQPFIYFKPCLVQDHEFHWSVGPNKLLLMEESDKRISYPCFFSSQKGTFSELVEIPSKILNRVHKVRAYVPPGYHENTLAYYPVAFMQDGQNLFFPEEAFMGHDWQVDDTRDTLSAMCAIEDFIFVVFTQKIGCSTTPVRPTSPTRDRWPKR